MKNKIDEGMLFAYYGGLLNEHQREMMRLYYECDMSLAEISEETDLTRQGVHDLITRCTQKLNEYEEKLGLVFKIKHTVYGLKDFFASCSFTDEQKIKAEKLLKEIEEI